MGARELKGKEKNGCKSHDPPPPQVKYLSPCLRVLEVDTNCYPDTHYSLSPKHFPLLADQPT